MSAHNSLRAITFDMSHHFEAALGSVALHWHHRVEHVDELALVHSDSVFAKLLDSTFC